MRILHIAPFNVAGVPISFVQAERQLGHESRLVTLASHPYGYEEDICLDLPFADLSSLHFVKRLFSAPEKLVVTNTHNIPEKIPLQWRPHGLAEKWLVAFREFLWKPAVRRLQDEIDFWNFDVYQLDGGLEFFRDGRTVRRLKELGKKVVVCYTGSDLRVRGVLPEIDRLADVTVTVEFDHVFFHPNIHPVLFPFFPEKFKPIQPRDRYPVRIGHAPSHRAAKGTDQILQELEELKKQMSIEIVLIEGLPYERALKLKQSCDLFVDQIGALGYGINALEALAFGIPVATSLVKGFAEKFPDHPFIDVTDGRIAEKLRPFVEDVSLRAVIGDRGRRWLERVHDTRQVVQRIHRLIGVENSI